jgi:protein-tyrosine phosphatase
MSNSDINIDYKDVETTDYSLIYYGYYLYNNIDSKLRYFIPFNTFEANEIIDGIYLGSINSAYDLEQLKKRGITHLLSVISGFDAPFPNEFKYLVINALDTENTNLFKIFDETNKFIENAIQSGGKVLVHCKAGRSRSVSILCAYIISTFGMPVDEALNSIKNKRDILEPNDGFVKQLNEYYRYKYNV